MDNFEAADLVDIDGDGKEHEVLPHSRATVWCEPGRTASGEPGLVVHTISEKKMNFGGGVGDLNSDGRPDVLRPDAWFEAPADLGLYAKGNTGAEAAITVMGPVVDSAIVDMNDVDQPIARHVRQFNAWIGEGDVRKTTTVADAWDSGRGFPAICPSIIIAVKSVGR